jgi:4a-hydroxytetrahydrobiopterin dehydratase
LPQAENAHQAVLICIADFVSIAEVSMSDLAERQCIPCRGGVPALEGEDLRTLATQVSDWQVMDEHHLQKSYRFSDFRATLDFVNRIGELAEAQGHHPDICFGWGKAEISIWTHKINGLTESDFILAAKIDKL